MSQISKLPICLFGVYSAHWEPYGPLSTKVLSEAARACGYEAIFWYFGRPLHGNAFPFCLGRPSSRRSNKFLEEFSHWLSPAEVSWKRIEKPAEYIVKVATHAEMVLDCLRPAVFCGWNTLEVLFGIVAEQARCRKIPVCSIEAGLLPGSIRFDHRDLSSERIFDDGKLNSGEDYGRQLLVESPIKRGSTPSARIPFNCLNFESSQIKVLLIGCAEADMGIIGEFQAKKSFLSGFTDCLSVAKFLAAQRDMKVLYRPHPLWKDSPLNVSDRVDPDLISWENSVDLIEVADVVVTVGSKLEGSVILSGKPLIRTGIGFLPSPKIGITARSPQALVDAIRSACRDFDGSLQKIQLYRLLGALHSSGWARVDKNKCIDEAISAIGYATSRVSSKPQYFSQAQIDRLISSKLVPQNCNKKVIRRSYQTVKRYLKGLGRGEKRPT